MKIRTLNDLDLENKTVLARVDINSPIDPESGEILDDMRIKSHLPTIDALKNSKLVLLAHQSRPGRSDFTTLEKHARILERLYSTNVKYIDCLFGSTAKKEINSLENGAVLVLENVRFCSEETNTAQERGLTGAAADTKIRLQINQLWLEESASLYAKINLQVQEGRVLLTGQVRKPEARVTAVRLAWQAKGVAEVINEIEVGDKSSLLDAARDEWIAAKLRARLLGDAAIASINYSIETVNGSVYLIGVAQNQAELDRVLAYARNIAYVRRVLNYMRLKTTGAS